MISKRKLRLAAILIMMRDHLSTIEKLHQNTPMIYVAVRNSIISSDGGWIPNMVSIGGNATTDKTFEKIFHSQFCPHPFFRNLKY
jgi:hypothetical protein